MCEAGKVGIWLDPNEANLIVSALNLLSTRIETAAAVYMDNLMEEIDKAVIKAQEETEIEEPVEEEEEKSPDEETDEPLLPMVLPPENDLEGQIKTMDQAHSRGWISTLNKL